MKTEIEKFVHKQLLKDGFEENEFGVISANFDNGNGSMNLTYVISDVLEKYLQSVPTESGEENCEVCNGDGFTVECCGYPGDTTMCCNRPVQEQCHACHATGKKLISTRPVQSCKTAEEVLKPYITEETPNSGNTTYEMVLASKAIIAMQEYASKLKGNSPVQEWISIKEALEEARKAILHIREDYNVRGHGIKALHLINEILNK